MIRALLLRINTDLLRVSSSGRKLTTMSEDGSSVAKKVKLNDEENNQVEKSETGGGGGDENDKSLKKRKYALLIGYCGAGYFGLQRNPSIKDKFRTIEDEVVDALVKLNAIPQGHADEMFKMSFQRAARTDKGVSAARNLLSLKMELADDTIQKLNDLLPKQIKVFGYRKTTKSFDSKNNCDGRTYTYILPTFAFCPIEENLTEEYRMTDEVLDTVNETLRLFTGTKNFHNFTAGKKFTDPSSKRYIISFECSKPFMKNGYEFAAIRVKGQSFMLHQIRKMVGMTIAVVRGLASKETIESCWTANKIDVPTAPALGLLLEKLHYEKYNKKFGADGLHSSLEFEELEQEIEQFKQEHIFSNIISQEVAQKSMFKWLSRLPISHFGIMDPSYMRGYYTGIGRALFLVDKNNKLNDDSEEEDTVNQTDE